MLQAGSRKRPAPGTSPLPQPTQPLADPNANSQISSNQYLPWNSSNEPPASPSYPDPATAYSSQAASQQPSSTSQLTRREPTLSAADSTPNHNGSADMWSYPGSGVQQTGETAWRNSSDDLDQKALAAQRAAQGKRKQIPPFVQKLSRSVYEAFRS